MEKITDDEVEEIPDLNYKIVVKLLKENANVEYIRNVTGYSEEEVLKIKNKACIYF